jgi:hypothetical protein
MSDNEATPTVVKTKREKPKSRTRRWADACAEASSALERVSEAIGDVEIAFSELTDIKAEYEEWRDNLPENLQQSTLGEKLEAVCDLDLDVIEAVSDAVGEARDRIEEAEGMDLPLGFGKD